MNKLKIEEIVPFSTYEAIRTDFRRRVIDLKKRRRIPLGDRITLVFENRETIRFQIQEMVRVERLDDPAKIREELETYNLLIPESGQLSATLFIEITESERVKEILDGFKGIDDGRSVFIELGGERVFGIFEEGHSKEEKLSAVHYVRFVLSPKQRGAFLDTETPAALVLDHAKAAARTPLTAEVRRELGWDLENPLDA